MINVLEKSINFGLGVFSYSREKIKKIIKKDETTDEDTQNLIDEFVNKGKNEREKLKKFIRKEITGLLDLNNLARKEDLIGREEIRGIVRDEIRKILDERD
ncbi:MAG: hypothetical protein PWR10_1852 [Halanaerobiales bacterium]|nr:hypothetical protein [Halanaerobiales bacterium]